MEPTFSKEWTDEERLKLVLVLSSMIQTDIPGGNYGKAIEVDDKNLPVKFRPNMQSIINVVLAPPEYLERMRADLEQIVRDELLGAEFFNTSLAAAREEWEG